MGNIPQIQGPEMRCDSGRIQRTPPALTPNLRGPHFP